jgi:hypothetical protein
MSAMSAKPMPVKARTGVLVWLMDWRVYTLVARAPWCVGETLGLAFDGLGNLQNGAASECAFNWADPEGAVGDSSSEPTIT